MINIAILGFGVVGSGVAEVISRNSKELAERLDGQEINVKHILDLRQFPDHPLGDRVTSDYNRILNDEDVFLVIETMAAPILLTNFQSRLCLPEKVLLRPTRR